MKIAFIVNQFPSLSETFILNQITGLIDRGHEVSIFASFPGENLKIHSDVKKYQLISKTYYSNIPKNKLYRVLKVFFLFPKYFLKDPKKIIKSLNFLKYKKEALFLKLFYTTIQFLEKDFDIINCHFGPNGILGAQLKDIGIKGKVITIFHAYDLTNFIKKNNKNVYDFLFKKGDLFISISDYWIKKIIELGCDPKKLIVHRMGIDVDKFRYKERKHNSGDKIKVLTIGRLVEKKGYKYMIEAISRIVRKNKNIEYIMAGEGPLLLNLKKIAKELNVEKYINFLGAINQKKAIALYREADIFVLPSVTAKNGDQEGIPVVLMEASAIGMPIISTYHTGIPEVVIDGKSGYLVPEKDVDDLVEKLERLIEHPEMWQGMRGKGRKLIEEKYDINKLNDRLVEIYKNCLENEK